MRIALLHPCYFPEVRGGSERIIRELGTELAARGHAVTLITSHPSLRRSVAVEDGMRVVRNPRRGDGLLKRRGYPEYMATMPLTAFELRRGSFDVVHAFHFTDGALAARSGRPAVYSVMGVIEPQALANKRRKLGLIAEATRGCTVLTLSDAAAESVWRRLGVRARTIYPGLDLSAFPVAERAGEPTIFCAAAVDDERKRVGLLIEAFALLRASRPDARLVLMRGRRRIDAEGVTLVDPVDNPAPLYGSAWVSALPSRAEAFGTVVVESLACGTPVVAARDGALPELIDRPEVGELFDGDDPAALAAALALLLDRVQASNGSIAAACRARAGDFSVARSADAHEALYRELIA